MQSFAPEKILASVIGIGSAFVSVFLLTTPVSDPVNATKLFALGAISCTSLALAYSFSRGRKVIKSLPLILVIIFILFSLNSVLNSSSPLSQNLYGEYGRNTGFIAYSMLCFLFLAASNLQSLSSSAIVVRGILIAGGLNVLYCGWTLLFGDFIGWDNPYGEILGTFGNPNFIGAFLGIFVATSFAILFSKDSSKLFRILLTILILIAGAEIQQSKAVQGVVVALGGVVIVGFYLIRSRTKDWKWITGYSVPVLFAGIISVLGALQIGPLSNIIYKVSVSLRGEYWAAGVRMGLEKPWTGIGMDSYGDWYRRMRDLGAMILPGPNVVTNAAHNVIIDIFAYGGFPLLLSYALIFLLGTFVIIKVTIRQKYYDANFVALTTIFICYQVQSFISINQIGVAIWGWVSCGTLIAYERNLRLSSQTTNLIKSKSMAKKNLQLSSQQHLISPSLVALMGMAVGTVISSPPLTADIKWRAALSSKDVVRVEKAMVPSYFNPINSFRYNTVVQLFEQSNLYDKAHYYALEGVKFNPENYEAWRLLYLIKNSTLDEKTNALKVMKKLDPLNQSLQSNQ